MNDITFLKASTMEGPGSINRFYRVSGVPPQVDMSILEAALGSTPATAIIGGGATVTVKARKNYTDVCIRNGNDISDSVLSSLGRIVSEYIEGQTP